MRLRRIPGAALALVLSIPSADPVEARLPGRPAVIVQDFHNRSYELKYDWVGTGLAYVVRKNLSLTGALEMLEDRKAKAEDPEPISDFVIGGEVRLDEAASKEEPKFVVFVTLDRVAEAGNRRQFLTEGTPGQLFEIGNYLTERIASYLGIDVAEGVKASFGRGMTRSLTAFQLFSEALVERRIHAKVEAYEKAIAVDPKFAESYFHLARVNMILRDQARAESNLRKTLELVPDFAPAHNDLAYMLAQQNKLSEAEAGYRAAIRIDPEDANYHLNLATLLSAAGKLEAAEEEYQTALRLRPEDVDAERGLRVAQVKLGKAPAESLAARAAVPAPTPTPASTPSQRKPTPTPAPTRVAAAGSPPALPTPAPRTAAAKTPAPASPTPAPVAPTPSVAASSPTPTPAAPRAAEPRAPAAGAGVADRRLAQELDGARAAVARARGDKAAGEALSARAAASAAAGNVGDAWLALGQLWLGEKLNHAAVDALRTAVDLEPANAAARESLAEAYTRIGKKSAADKERAAIAGGGR